MPTTSNFGWTTPADTDLVKDGAAAIRTLGNGIDTSLVDLKGGTTGQILSKASNTDLDYTWIANDQGDITEVQAGTGISVASGTGPIPVITNTVATAFDAAGDLVYGTGADTFTKLSLGTAGQVLKVNSGATAPEWAAPAGAAIELVKARTTFSNVADTSTTFDGVFTSTYRNYLIVLDNVYGATTDADLQMIMKYSTSTEQTTDYYWSDVRARFNVTVTTSQGNATGSYTIAEAIGGSSYPGGGTINLNAGVASEACQIQSHYSTTFYGSTESSGGGSTVARTYTGFKLLASTGNITGAVTIYGLKVS